MKKCKLILKTFILFILASFILIKLPFSKNIERTVSAKIYKNGIEVGETFVYINGNKTNYIFSNRQIFIGEFKINCYDITCSEGTETKIVWEDESQHITYYLNGNFFQIVKSILVFIMIITSMVSIPLWFFIARILGIYAFFLILWVLIVIITLLSFSFILGKQIFMEIKSINFHK